MKKKKIVIIAIIILILATGLWFGGLIPRQIGKFLGKKYMSEKFPEMQLEYVKIEWNKYYGDYIITFKDKDNQSYGCVIGPKYFPVSIGQGIYAIEEIYKEKYQSQKLTNTDENQPKDLTQKILTGMCYSSGIIYNIDENYIYFSDRNSNQCFISKSSFSYINGRTAKDMNVNDVNVGDYLDNDEQRIIIYRNISGDELNKELLYNMTLTEDERVMLVNITEIKNINIINDETAMVKVEYGDIIGNYLTDERFEATVEFNSNTKFYSKGNNINSIRDLEYAKANITSIVLDRDSIYKKNPAIVTRFECTDN